MAQAAFALQDQPTEYAIGKTFGDSIDWVGVVRGAPDALAATFTAQHVFGSTRVSACPMQRLTATDRALARAGRVIEVRE